MKVLVVDDELKDLQKMESILKKNNYEVLSVNDGASAYDLVNSIKFDLILIDIKIPTLTGYDLLRLVRQRINHKTPIVFVSIIPKKSADLTDVEGFIQKPFSDKIFIKEINKVLKKK